MTRDSRMGIEARSNRLLPFQANPSLAKAKDRTRYSLGDAYIRRLGSCDNGPTTAPTPQEHPSNIHRYSGYVLGPRRHLATMQVATRNVLSDRGIEMKGVSTPRG